MAFPFTPELTIYLQGLYDEGMQPRKIARSLLATHRIAVTGDAVRAAIDCHRERRIPEALKEKVRAEKMRLWESNTVLAARLGLPVTQVAECCKGMVPPAGATVIHDRQYRGPHAGARKGLIQFENKRDVEIPRWVPEQLRDLYLSISERDCEEQAAIVCRRLKHGRALAEAA